MGQLDIDEVTWSEVQWHKDEYAALVNELRNMQANMKADMDWLEHVLEKAERKM